MDRNYIDDQHVIARYLADQLPEDERVSFETYCLEHPELIDVMERTARLKVGLAVLRDKGELADLLKPRPLGQKPLVRFASAAALVLAMGSSVSVVFQSSLYSFMGTSLAAISGDTPLPQAEWTIDTLRSTAGGTAVELKATPEALVLQMTPEPPVAAARFRVTLEQERAPGRVRAIASGNRYVADSSGTVTVFINSEEIRAGHYHLRLTPLDGGPASETIDYPIDFTAPEPAAL